MSDSRPPVAQRVRASGHVRLVVRAALRVLLALAAVAVVTSLYIYFIGASRVGQNDAFAAAAATMLGSIALAVGLVAGLGVYLVRARSRSGPANPARDR